jgi:hypothetical protein
MVYFVLIKDHGKSYQVVSALIAFSAILSGLAYSAASATENSDGRRWYAYAGKCFFEATVLAGICLVINYLYISEVVGRFDDWKKVLEMFLEMLRGITYGVGSVQLHFGLFIIQREFANKS